MMRLINNAMRLINGIMILILCLLMICTTDESWNFWFALIVMIYVALTVIKEWNNETF